MKVTRVYADSNGDSMFEEIEVPLTDREIGRLSDNIKVTTLQMRTVSADYDYDFITRRNGSTSSCLDGVGDREFPRRSTTVSDGRDPADGRYRRQGHRTRNLESGEHLAVILIERPPRVTATGDFTHVSLFTPFTCRISSQMFTPRRASQRMEFHQHRLLTISRAATTIIMNSLRGTMTFDATYGVDARFNR